MKKGDIKNIFKNINLARDIDSGKREVAPYRNWKLIVVIFFFGFFASASFAVYLFLGVRNENLFVDNVQKDVGVKLNVEKLEQVIQGFDAKEETSRNLEAGEGGLVDPSR